MNQRLTARPIALAIALATVLLGSQGPARAGQFDHLAGSGQPGLYTIRPGDTLYKIARKQLGSSARWSEIAQLNGLSPSAPDIRPGQVIRLPAPGSQPGSLARDPGTSSAGSADRPGSARRRRRRYYHGVRVVPRGHVVLELPAPRHHRRSTTAPDWNTP